MFRFMSVINLGKGPEHRLGASPPCSNNFHYRAVGRFK